MERQKGFTLIELLIAIVVIAVLGAAVYAIYNNRVRPAMESNAIMTTFQSVIAALDDARAANNNAYPASGSSQPLTSVAGLAPFIGSSANDVVGWTYRCPSSTTNLSTMTIQIPAQNLSSDTANRVVRRISSMPVWNATLSGNYIVATRNGVVCR